MTPSATAASRMLQVVASIGLIAVARIGEAATQAQTPSATTPETPRSAAAPAVISTPTPKRQVKLSGAPKRGREAATRSIPGASGPQTEIMGTADTASTSSVETPLNEQTVRVNVGAGSSTRALSLPRGKSAVIELPTDARDVVVSDPKVVEVILSTPRRVYLLGQASGQTDAVFFDGAGRQLLRLDIRVDQDVAAIAQTLNRIVPGAQIKIDAVNDSIVVSGMAPDTNAADKIVRIAQGFVAKPDNVVNMLSIAGRDQVMIKVRIVEVNRSVIKQLGFNLSEVLGQAGGNQTVWGLAPTFGVNGALLGGVTGGYKKDTTTQPIMTQLCNSSTQLPNAICNVVVRGPNSGVPNWNTATVQNTVGSPGVNQATAKIQAFERVGLVRTLAEPNVTAISGESAKFLAGGEFPVPVSQDATGKITVEFKQYGIGLGFSPIVLGSGRISMKISTEVSEINSLNSFSTGTSSGATLVIPGLNVRRVETAVELPSGGAIMLAGLIQNTTKQTLDSLPGLLELPVLGTLFRSRDFQNNQSELVVILTPYIVKPTSLDQLATPADGMVFASDIETDLLGRMTKGFSKPAAANGAAGATYRGPFGYVVE